MSLPLQGFLQGLSLSKGELEGKLKNFSSDSSAFQVSKFSHQSSWAWKDRRMSFSQKPIGVEARKDSESDNWKVYPGLSSSLGLKCHFAFFQRFYLLPEVWQECLLGMLLCSSENQASTLTRKASFFLRDGLNTIQVWRDSLQYQQHRKNRG